MQGDLISFLCDITLKSNLKLLVYIYWSNQDVLFHSSAFPVSFSHSFTKSYFYFHTSHSFNLIYFIMYFNQLIISASFLAATALAAPLDARGSSTSPANAKVTLAAAFTSGAGNQDPNSAISTGVGKGADTYKCYSGGWQSFPSSSEWVSFDAMWNSSTTYLKESCANTGAFGSGDSPTQIDDMYNSILSVASASFVDPRFIYATILQESSGCVNIDTSQNPDPSQPDNPYVSLDFSFSISHLSNPNH